MRLFLLEKDEDMHTAQEEESDWKVTLSLLLVPAVANNTILFFLVA